MAVPGKTAEKVIHKYNVLRAELENERSSFMSHWRELGEHVAPRRLRFSVSETNRGERRNQKIIDSTATMSLRTLRSGMMGGVTSPARPWFRLSTPEPSLMDITEVKQWLDLVGNRMTAVFLKSNLYNVLPIVYSDIGLLATSAMAIEEDFEDVVRFNAFPIGTYMIATNEKGQVDVFLRDFRLTVKQLVQRFGNRDDKGNIDWTVFSESVKSLWENDQREVWIDVVHVIEPNDEYNPKRVESEFKKFKSVYFERGTGGPRASGYEGPMDDRFLREKGYDYFPILCPRWEVSSEDAYGTSCPGMDALGDIKQLMLGEKRSMQAIEKMVNPPMVAPTALQNSKSSILPGDITYVDVREGQQGFKPAYEVNPRIVELEGKQNTIRDRIKKAFYEDLFLMLAESDRREITATEIDERKEEKLLALGPVLEQLNQDLLDPLIDITFDIMLRQGKIPPPPQQLSGQPLKVEYISIMAQAQKVAGISGIERFTSFVGNLVARDPSVAAKMDTDALVDIYGDMTSVPAAIIRSNDAANQIRQQQAQAQQKQQQMQQMQQMAATGKDLSQTDTGDGNNALQNLMAMAKAGQLTPQ